MSDERTFQVEAIRARREQRRQVQQRGKPFGVPQWDKEVDTLLTYIAALLAHAERLEREREALAAGDERQRGRRQDGKS